MAFDQCRDHGSHDNMYPAQFCNQVLQRHAALCVPSARIAQGGLHSYGEESLAILGLRSMQMINLIQCTLPTICKVPNMTLSPHIHALVCAVSALHHNNATSRTYAAGPCRLELFNLVICSLVQPWCIMPMTCSGQMAWKIYAPCLSHRHHTVVSQCQPKCSAALCQTSYGFAAGNSCRASHTNSAVFLRYQR